MSVSNVLKLLSVMFVVGISGVQGSLIHSHLIESNMQFLTVRISEVNVTLYEYYEPLPVATIPLNMIIGGRLTQSEIMQKLDEGAILVVNKNESNHYALYFKRSKSENTGFHLGTYDTSRASARMVSRGSAGCCDGGVPIPRGHRGQPRTPDWNPYTNK
ncbi:hypothetical protein [Candidatus Bodocaedibacter vickermanii]|uniref:Uncharacterized protein n=1 Tax=Candidatus Bodocaedibacter vickermanii TaxID=2741701 RepID=A0A7L9RT30_9PROT|nr:hypothetical protein CPBP_00290 [Candidatus Paracaedibacteraceae bacterium 'Lake Konstanz']